MIGTSPDGLGVQEIAGRMGLKPPTVHNLVRTLVEAGMVEKLVRPIRYRVGPVVLEIAQHQANLGPRGVAGPIMLDLARQLPRATVILAEYIGGEVVVSLRVSPDQPGVLQRPPHQTLSAYTSASALVFQAFWPTDMKRAYRSRYPMGEYASAWGSTEALDDYLNQAAKSKVVGYPFTTDGRLPLASPIFSPQGTLVASVGMSHPVGDHDGGVSRLATELAGPVREAAERISRALGPVSS